MTVVRLIFCLCFCLTLGFGVGSKASKLQLLCGPEGRGAQSFGKLEPFEFYKIIQVISSEALGDHYYNHEKVEIFVVCISLFGVFCPFP